ncbi:MAG: AIR synthase related protein [Marinilabiliales bacterium]|nr:AIR synthase related protein [Marinilabiliales bacterium]
MEPWYHSPEKLRSQQTALSFLPFFPGGDIGELAINGTVNDVAMCGAIPKYLTLSFIVEEGLLMNELKQIIDSIKKTADVCGVQIITGDTKVVERGKGDKIFINTTGFGEVHPKANIDSGKIQEGIRSL